MKKFALFLIPILLPLSSLRADNLGAPNVAPPNQVGIVGGIGGDGFTHRLLLNNDGSQIITVKAANGPANSANGQVTATTTAGTLKVANATRRSLLIKNLDATITVYIGVATVTAGNGLPLRPGESTVITSTNLYQVISASGSPIVAYIEEYD